MYKTLLEITNVPELRVEVLSRDDLVSNAEISSLSSNGCARVQDNLVNHLRLDRTPMQASSATRT
jgi:hypothetical protein